MNSMHIYLLDSGWFKRILIQDSQQAYSLCVVLHIKVGTMCEHRLGLMEILKKLFKKKDFFFEKYIRDQRQRQRKRKRRIR